MSEQPRRTIGGISTTIQVHCQRKSKGHWRGRDCIAKLRRPTFRRLIGRAGDIPLQEMDVLHARLKSFPSPPRLNRMNDLKSEKEHRIFRSLWWLVNLLVLVALLCTIWTAGREYSVREYLDGFSDAIIPDTAPPQEKVEAILAWMRDGPPRQEAKDLNELSPHDPTDTLNYRQLLECLRERHQCLPESFAECRATNQAALVAYSGSRNQTCGCGSAARWAMGDCRCHLSSDDERRAWQAIDAARPA